MASPLRNPMKATFMVTNKRITNVKKEMKEWKAEMEGWWKEKANIFSGSKRWKEEEDLMAEVKDLHGEVKTFKEVLPNFSATVQPFFHVESWSNFPKERDRLFDLLASTSASGVLFISGDVHFCEITRYDCGISYPLYEFTSSGISHAVETAVAPYFSFLIRLAAWLTPSTMRVYRPDCRYRSCVYGKQNFGTLVIDWDAKTVTITGQLRDENGSSVAQETIRLSQLQPVLERARTESSRTIRHCTLEGDLPWYSKYFLASIVFGTLSGISWLGLFCLYYTCARLRKLTKAKLA